MRRAFRVGWLRADLDASGVIWEISGTAMPSIGTLRVTAENFPRLRRLVAKLEAYEAKQPRRRRP